MEEAGRRPSQQARRGDVQLLPLKLDRPDMEFTTHTQVTGMTVEVEEGAGKFLQAGGRHPRREQKTHRWQPTQPLPLGAARDPIREALGLLSEGRRKPTLSNNGRRTRESLQPQQ